MAIQLNERDNLIFKLLDEHQVLLEKHISFFISADQKPVLIRDRLRKLFYLDYLLCQRHKETLPWWTTPTKPLVYTLSPMSRDVIGANEIDSNLDLNDCNMQRHLLEVANLRMLFLIDEKDALISNFSWTTCNAIRGGSPHLDAKVSFVRNAMTHRVGIINHPTASSAEALSTRLKNALAEDDVETVWIISRDEAFQESLQKLATHIPELTARVAFATHQELYKSGIVKTRWQNTSMRPSCIFVDSLDEAKTIGFSLRPHTASA